MNKKQRCESEETKEKNERASTFVPGAFEACPNLDASLPQQPAHYTQVPCPAYQDPRPSDVRPGAFSMRPPEAAAPVSPFRFALPVVTYLAPHATCDIHLYSSQDCQVQLQPLLF